MLKHFTLLCSKPGAVKPMDLLNTVTALVPYAKSQKSLVVPITISMVAGERSSSWSFPPPEIAGGADYDLDGRVFVDWMQGQLRVASADEQSSVLFSEDGREIGSSDRFVRLKASEEARRFSR